MIPFFHCISYVALNGTMIAKMIDDAEVIMICFMVIAQHLSGRTEEHHERLT